MVQFQAALHKEKNQLVGAGASTPQLIDQTVSPNQASGGFSGFDNTKFTRPTVKGDLTQYWGSHTIKLGADWERPDAVVDRYQGGGGQRIYKLIQRSTGIIYYRHRYFVNDQVPGFSRTDPSTWKIALPLSSLSDLAASTPSAVRGIGTNSIPCTGLRSVTVGRSGASGCRSRRGS